MHQPTDWISPVVRSVARELDGAQDLSARFRIYMTDSDLSQFHRRFMRSSEFGKGAFFVASPKATSTVGIFADPAALRADELVDLRRKYARFWRKCGL